MRFLFALCALSLLVGCTKEEDPPADTQQADSQQTDSGEQTDSQQADSTEDSTEDTTATLQWYTTCGDPVCAGHTEDPSIPACTTETEGASCSAEGTLCDPVNDCNARLLCATSDPKQGPGGCPISQRALKTEIRYLSPQDRAAVAQDLLSVPLARYRYTFAPDREHLGFMIEDIQPSPAIDPERNMVDLYGLLSMTVAAYQTQAQEVAAMRLQIQKMQEEIEQLRALLPRP